MRARVIGTARLFLLYVFVVVVGILGGRIGAAAWLYSELGWTATWLEISTWGPSHEPEGPLPDVYDGIT